MRIEIGDIVKAIHGEFAGSTGKVQEVATGIKVKLFSDSTERWFRPGDLVVIA